MGEKSTNYRPTRVEQKLLDVLLDPASRLKTVTEICGIANCDRKTYYNAFGKAGFRELYERLSVDMVKQHVGPIINTFVREATRGSFPHGKVLLEMAGVYTESAKLDVNHKGGVKVVHNVPRPTS